MCVFLTIEVSQMSQVIQITDWSLHKFLEKVEEAVIEGYRTHKTPTSFAKSIGGRYVVTMVKPDEMPAQTPSAPETLTVDELPPHTNVLPPVKPAARKTTKKAGDSDE